jgi:tripartite-type tricarboxylate transporter receptor subunit TctC
MIVPYAPGGGSDIVARIAGQKMTEALGQAIVVDNRPGAAGMLGAEMAANAPADGYTLLLADSSFTINASYYTKQVRYDARKDFVPVSLIADTPYLLVAHPGVAAASLKDFIALAKAQPGKLNVGSAGNGSGSHLIGELFRLKTGINFNHIPYKGSGPSTADVVAGQIQATFATAPGAVPFIKAGRLKALVVATPKRSATLPDVPTFIELGFPDIVVTNWYGIVAPAGTPKAVVQRLYDEVGRAIAQPEVRERLAGAALEPVPQSPGQFGQLIDAEVKRWAQVVKEANIKTE